MARIAEVGRSSLDARLGRAEDINDAPAPPLKRPKPRAAKEVRGNRLVGIGPIRMPKGYPDYKAAGRWQGRNPVRDWFRTGLTRRSIKVLAAQPNKARIGPTNETAALRIRFNNRRWPQYGLSPRNRQDIAHALKAERYVKVEAA